MRWLFLAVLGCAHAGCAFQANSAGAAPNAQGTGQITFLWSFDGKTCAQASQVRTIHAAILGLYGSEPLDTGYACTWGNVDGVTLEGFYAGNYTFTLDALDATGQVLYTATGSAYVKANLNVPVPVTLRSVSQSALVPMTWTFDGKSCAQAGVSEVDLRVDGQSAQTFTCTDASSSPAVDGGSVWLDEGTHQIQLDGFVVHSGDRQTWYSASRSVIIDAQAVSSGSASSVDLDLDVVAAQATFMPKADAQGTAFSCEAAGAGVLFIRVVDPTSSANCYPKDSVTGGCGRYSDCATAAAQGFRIDYLPVEQTRDGAGGPWKATWTADVLAFKDLSSVSAPLYEGLLTASVEASTAATYAVPMVKKP